MSARLTADEKKLTAFKSTQKYEFYTQKELKVPKLPPFYPKVWGLKPKQEVTPIDDFPSSLVWVGAKEKFGIRVCFA